MGDSLRKDKHNLTKRAIGALDKWRPDRLKNTSSAPFQVVDFFCGAGGMSAGFAAMSQIKRSFHLIGGCDIDEKALQTYSQNFNTAGIKEDIRELASNEEKFDSFVRKLNNYDPNKPLIVIGCAPCQGFSSHRKRSWSKKDNRNTLISAFANVAIRLKPVCIVMENVPEMLSKKYWDYFQTARNAFENEGYTVHQSIYNVASFGVPQERFRSLVIAMRKDFVLPEPILSSDSFASVRDAIGHLPALMPGETDPRDSMHRSTNHRLSTIETIRAIPKDGGSRPIGIGPKCLDKIKGFYDVYGRLYWDRPSITITHYARNPASGRFVHPEQDRGLTMREAAQLQGFPLGFKFSGSVDAIFKQIGEAVPPKFSCAVAANVFLELNSEPPTESERLSAMPSLTTPVNSSYSSVIAGLKQKRNRNNNVQLY